MKTKKANSLKLKSQPKWSDRIAITGIGCRFPGLYGPSALWDALLGGVSVVGEISKARLQNNPSILQPPERQTGGERFGSFFSAVDEFDASFFNISPREAAVMDPQQRFALEVSAEAIVDAGYTRESLQDKRVGVYVGIHQNEYYWLAAREQVEPSVYTSVGGSRNGVAGRISFVWDFNGPSLTVDSDRSSSLTAVHLACNALASGEIDVAVVGGVNIILSSETSSGLSNSSMLSPEGVCRFGDAQASGVVRGEGVGFVVLKTSKKAIEDGDRVYSLIVSSALNHNGATRDDIMVPSREGQVSLLRMACQSAGISPSDISYIEAHGTGTPVGDQVELSALGEALGKERNKSNPLLVGSIKTNLGHTESAAGIAGLIKVALILNQRVIPASLNCKIPNPQVAFKTENLQIVTAKTNLQIRNEGPLYAGVSSFGLTGTNAHVLLESTQQVESVTKDSKAEVVLLSSHHENGLIEIAGNLIRGIKQNKVRDDLRDLAYTSTRKRDHNKYKLSVAARSLESLATNLEAFTLGEEIREVCTSTARSTLNSAKKNRIVFVFPGQGGQWLGMGKKLFEEEPVFKKRFLECDAVVRQIAGWSVTDTVFNVGDDSWLTDLEKVQVALTTVYVSLCGLYDEWGIVPDVVIGTSMGEIAAGYCAGNLSLEDAFKIICRRTGLMKRFSGKGEMAVIDLSADQVSEYLKGHENQVSIAICNSPTSTVISGEKGVVQNILRDIERTGTFCKSVPAAVASHSPQMQEIADALVDALRDIHPKKGKIPLFSTVHSRFISGDEMSADYWWLNLRQPVFFSNAIQELLIKGYDTFVECSPHPVLWSSILSGIAHSKLEADVFPTLKREKDERNELMSTIGALWTRGINPNWQKIYPAGNVATLHPLCWEKTKFWYHKSATQSVVKEIKHSNSPVAAPLPELSPLKEVASPPTVKNLSPLLIALNEASSQRERVGILVEFIQRQIAKVLNFKSADQVEIVKPFREMGLKSVMAIELRNMLSSALKQQLPSSIFFNYSTVLSLAEHLGEVSVVAKQNLGNILIGSGAATSEQVAEALEVQNAVGGKERIGSILLRRGHISPNQLQRALLIQAQEPIAIIGASCRFPGGVTDLETFWKHLSNGVDSVGDVPVSRWNTEEFRKGNLEKLNIHWGGFINNVDQFDANFFGITRREAERMDPQQRLLLETIVDGLEHASQPLDKLAGTKTGVFLGMLNNNDYALLKYRKSSIDGVDRLDSTGNANSIAAGRIAYFLGTHGPALTIDTACSSSLVAVHLACQSLKSGESSMAIAAGVNLILSPETSVGYSKNRMLSPTGRCKTFDAKADGYVRGEGCGVVILKKLSDAKNNGDRILGVIVGSAVNQDGRSSGLTAPNGSAQKSLYLEALNSTGYDAHRVSYIEAHGTGTPLGDPIEISSIRDVYGGNQREKNNPLYVGSVKTNIGHLEAAAGVAGIIKVILSLQNKQIVPHLHFQNLNPEITLKDTNIRVPVDRVPWTSNNEPRLAAVSSFGFSGTNAHIIIEEAPPTPARTETNSPIDDSARVILVSAKTEQSIKALAEKYSKFLSEDSEITLGDFSHTCAIGRAHYNHRMAFVGSSLHEVRKALADFSVDRKGAFYHGKVSASNIAKTAWIFTGGGFESYGIGVDLYQKSVVFERAIQEVDGIVRKLEKTSIVDEFFIGDRRPSGGARFEGLVVACAVQYALAQTWLEVGARPDIIVGVGFGELIGACVAGIIKVEDAFQQIVARAKHLESYQDQFFSYRVKTKVSDELEELEKKIIGVHLRVKFSSNEGIFVVEKKASENFERHMVSIGAHSVRQKDTDVSHCDIVSDVVDSTLEGHDLRTPKYKFFSSSEVSALGAETATNWTYWRDQFKKPIVLHRTLEELRGLGITTVLNLGSAAAELGAAYENYEMSFVDSWTGSLGLDCFTHNLCKFYVKGHEVNWHCLSKVLKFHGGKKVEIPNYAFQRERYWVDVATAEGLKVQEVSQPTPAKNVEAPSTFEAKMREVVALTEEQALERMMKKKSAA